MEPTQAMFRKTIFLKFMHINFHPQAQFKYRKYQSKKLKFDKVISIWKAVFYTEVSDKLNFKQYNQFYY